MPRFVLLYHDCPSGHPRASHWDLMLEGDGELRAWALSALPLGWRAWHERTHQLQSNCPPLGASEVTAERLPDHRPLYLEYEGPVSGGRGTVVRIDGGLYTSDSLDSPVCRAELAGELWQGALTLRAASDDSPEWTLTSD